MYYSQFWAIDMAGWSAEQLEASVVVVPCDVEAALTIGTFHFDSPVATIEEQERIAQKGAPAEAERIPVTCGDFVGLRAEYQHVDEEDGTMAYWRVWWLFSGHVHLYISYNCAPEHSGHHRNVVDWMLGTLKAVASDAVSVNGASHSNAY